MADNQFVNKYRMAVRDYLSDISHVGMSETTISNYRKRLKYFEDFWAQGDPVSDPTSEDVRNWRDDMLNNGRSPKTVRQYITELNGFFNFCCDESVEIYERNPITKRMYPKLRNENTHPYDKILSNEDIEKLWVNDNTIKSRSWARDYAIVMLLLDGKIRNAELLDMKLSDINFEYKEVCIPRGKGNRFRYVTLSDISMSAVMLYLQSGIRPSSCSDDDYLFGTTAKLRSKADSSPGEWHRGTSQWLSNLVKNHVRDITGKDGYRTHSLRHNGARIDLNIGVPIERIQSELGHSSVTTTEIYAGRLNSVRHQHAMRDVVASRDEQAAKNMEKVRKGVYKPAT